MKKVTEKEFKSFKKANDLLKRGVEIMKASTDFGPIESLADVAATLVDCNTFFLKHIQHLQEETELNTKTLGVQNNTMAGVLNDIRRIKDELGLEDELLQPN